MHDRLVTVFTNEVRSVLRATQLEMLEKLPAICTEEATSALNVHICKISCIYCTNTLGTNTVTHSIEDVGNYEILQL